MNQTLRKAPRIPRPLVEVALILPIAYLLGVVVARFGGPQTLGLLVGGTMVVSAFVEPRYLLFLIPPTIALSTELDVAGLPLRPEDFLIAFLGGAYVLRLVTRQTTLPQSPLTKPILILIGIELVSTALGVLRGTTTLSLTSPYSGFFFWLKNVEVFLLVIVTVRHATLTA